MIFNMMDGAGGGGKATVTYTGTHATESYTLGGKAYTLYKITGSGTLTVKGRVKDAKVWLCGGGANGGGGDGSGGGMGGGGAFCAQYDVPKMSGAYVITVAGGGGSSNISLKGNTVFAANGASGANGGTGGGGSDGNGGTGDGMTKYPFGDSGKFQCHCAGGGGGTGAYNLRYDPDNYTTYSNVSKGGYGGSNGAAGGRGSSPVTYRAYNAPGGSVGGGTGGSKSRGSNATFYGSGGGGGSVDGRDNYDYPYYGINTTYSGGAGYQGIVYVCVPA